MDRSYPKFRSTAAKCTTWLRTRRGRDFVNAIPYGTVFRAHDDNDAMGHNATEPYIKMEIMKPGWRLPAKKAVGIVDLVSDRMTVCVRKYILQGQDMLSVQYSSWMG